MMMTTMITTMMTNDDNGPEMALFGSTLMGGGGGVHLPISMIEVSILLVRMNKNVLTPCPFTLLYFLVLMATTPL